MTQTCDTTVGDRHAALSGPPLSVGRLRLNSLRDPGVRWRGAGLIAFVGRLGGRFDAADQRVTTAPRYVTAADAGEAMARVGGGVTDERPNASEDRGAGADERTWVVVREFFAAGRRGAVLVDSSGESRSEAMIEDDAAAAVSSAGDSASRSGWVGEDGGPGRRTGVYQLLDLQDVTTVVLPEPSTPVRRSEVLRLADTRPDKLFVLADDGPGPVLELLRENVALSRASLSATARSGAEDSGLGGLCALLEASDFAEPTVCARQLESHQRRALVRCRRLDAWWALEAWRRREGLRRSIELGTRWIVLEHHHSRLWRRLERQVTGFLYRMANFGLVESPRRRPFDVRCAPVAGATARVEVRVRVALAGRWGRASGLAAPGAQEEIVLARAALGSSPEEQTGGGDVAAGEQEEKA